MENIQIRAQVDDTDISICRFFVDRSVLEGSASFAREDAPGDNRLANSLFRIPGIARVDIEDNVVTIAKDTADDWRGIGKQIGTAIRRFLDPPPEIPEDQLLTPQQLRVRVQEILDEQINPGVASHGGFVELLDVQDDNVYLRMGGGCQGCGAADITLRMGIERLIREHVPQVREVLDTTDHAAGQNPYYTPSK